MLGPRRNGVKLNVFATIIEAVLILLSLILMATTLFPHLNATLLSEIGGAVLATILVVAGVVIWWNRRHGAGVTMIETEPALPKDRWTMPPLALLSRPPASTGRKLTMFSMEEYLLLAVVMLIVKAIGLGAN